VNIIEFGDCRETMRRWKEQGVKAQTCVTSPPYYGLRDYGHDGQIGLEETPEQYIKAMVEVFRCVWDVLADDGTLWLNLGDSYFSTTKGSGGSNPDTSPFQNRKGNENFQGFETRKLSAGETGCKPKDLIGIPWMLAFALRADGWYLRQDIIWHKPNPMPESVQDRCTKAHEYIFLLSKSQKYYFDNEAVKEPAVTPIDTKSSQSFKAYGGKARENYGTNADNWKPSGTRNKRSVWTVTTKPYKGAHFATFPTDLITPCILAGAPAGGVVLDPFMGSGTTAAVALQHGRQYLGCELNPEYGPLQQNRIDVYRSLFDAP
jgi:DNA modification methylase